MKIKEIEESRSVFIKPKNKYYFGKLRFGTPYFYPTNFCSTIIWIRRLKMKQDLDKINEFYKSQDKLWMYSNAPWVRRTKYKIIKLFDFHFYIEMGWPIMFYRYGLGWKDKYGAPRFEWEPSWQIYLFKWQFCKWLKADNKYWEQILWWFYYSDKNINKAKETWPWEDFETGKSTWDDKYLKIKPKYIELSYSLPQ